MQLRELRDAIESLVAEKGEEVLDLEVMGEYNYGDRCNTRALANFDDMQVVVPEGTAYSESGLAIKEVDEDEDEDDDDKNEPVVALIKF